MLADVPVEPGFVLVSRVAAMPLLSCLVLGKAHRGLRLPDAAGRPTAVRRPLLHPLPPLHRSDHYRTTGSVPLVTVFSRVLPQS